MICVKARFERAFQRRSKNACSRGHTRAVVFLGRHVVKRHFVMPK